MKGILASLSIFALSVTGALNAKCCCTPQDYDFYLKVGTGVSFSQSAKVHAPSPPWTETIQGYNSRLGNRAIAGVALGLEYNKWIDVDVSVSYRSNFRYRKSQTPEGEDFTFKREFDLDVVPILFSVTLLGRDISCLNWDFACGKIYPTLGVGVGVSNLLITNFRTTGLPPNGDSSPYPSFSSENERTHRNKFTYTVQLGIEYSYNDCWALSTGYRWFDAGSFKGPRYLRLDTGSAIDVAGDAWKMRFRASEWFVEFKYFL